MAKIENGFMGGFSGRLGPAVGYQWNGRWCVRALPRMVTNPRTAAQQEHRALFKQEVQLAARMRWVANVGMKGVARQMGLTAQNLFIKANQQAFSMVNGELEVDYPTLQVSLGTVAPVAIVGATIDHGNVLTVRFEKNPEHRAANAYDSVYLWMYSPETGRGYLTNAVYRRAKRIDVMLPEWLDEGGFHLYAFVQDKNGRCSATAYGQLSQGVGDEEDGASDEDEVVLGSGGAGGSDGVLDVLEGRAFHAELAGGSHKVGHG
jgi:hypothetical protein